MVEGNTEEESKVIPEQEQAVESTSEEPKEMQEYEETKRIRSMEFPDYEMTEYQSEEGSEEDDESAMLLMPSPTKSEVGAAW